MLLVQMPAALEERLEIVAKKSGKTKEDLALDAIVEQIEDLEDGFIAMERMRDDNGQWLLLDEVKAELGLNEANDEDDR